MRVGLEVEIYKDPWVETKYKLPWEEPQNFFTRPSHFRTISQTLLLLDEKTVPFLSFFIRHFYHELWFQ